MAGNTPQSSAQTGPVGDGDYEVQEGDCIESIAATNGLLWQTIWNHPNNESIKNARASRNILLPGDHLFIPEKVLKTYDRSTDARHTFVRKGIPCKLRLRVLQSGKPRANESYRLVVDGKEYSGTTDGDGWVEVAIPPTAQSGELTVGSTPLQRQVYSLDLGGMDPVTEPSGIQKRLTNLGFDCEETGTMDEPTRTALALFQKGENLDATGDPDSDTLDKLKKRHGS
jgi:hypothetical protein